MYRKRKDYIINEHWTNALGKNHKKHISIALLEKESDGIAKKNEAIDTNKLQDNINKYITMYASVDYARYKAKQQHKTKRRYY